MSYDARDWLRVAKEVDAANKKIDSPQVNGRQHERIYCVQQKTFEKSYKTQKVIR